MEAEYNQDYIEHIQIGDIYIDMETPIYTEYRNSLRAVGSMEELTQHCNKWGKVSYELVPLVAAFDADDFSLLMEFRDSKNQNEMLEKQIVPSQWCSFILPINFLPYMIIASHFGIPDGLALLRLFHVRRASIDAQGYLRIDRTMENK